MSTKIILFVSRHVPTIEQINIAASLGFAIRHVGDFNAFAPSGEFEKFLNEKRLGQTKWDDTGVFGIEQRDVVVCVVHPALALRASLVGHTVVVFENAARPAEGTINSPPFSNLRFYDPQFNGFFINIPYTPPEIPSKQELTDDEKIESNKNKNGIKSFSASFFQLSDLIKKISDQFQIELDDFSGEFSDACSSVSYGDASHTLINASKFAEILGDMNYDLNIDLIKSWIPDGGMIDLES